LSLAASHIFKWEPVFIFQAALTRHSASFLCPELHTAAILIDELDAGGLKGAPKGSLREANFKYEAKRQDLSKTSSASLWLRPGSNIWPQS
jgi:hypothetical protein